MTIRASVGIGHGFQDFTGNALHLEDAVCIARGKLREAREKAKKK